VINVVILKIQYGTRTRVTASYKMPIYISSCKNSSLKNRNDINPQKFRS